MAREETVAPLRLSIVAVWTLLAASLCAQTMQSGSGAPGAGVGANGDLYNRTDTHWIYGPKAGGAWPSTYSVILGRGCTTAFHIDWYCTGRGVGGVDPNMIQSPVEPNPLFGVDAGLTGSTPDGTVHTTAQVLSKYTTPDAFYAAVGYTGITHYWAITTTGNDGTCSRQTTVALAVANACATFSGIGGAPAAGDAVIMRAGTYATNWSPGTNGTAGNPIYVINYPGEHAIIDTGPLGGTNGIYVPFLSYYTIDGLEMVNSSGSYDGSGWGITIGYGSGMVIRNCWIHDFGDDIISGDATINVLVERNVGNNGGTGDGHDFYLGSRFTPSTGGIVQDNVIYNGDSAPMQFNGRFPGLLFTRNIIHDGQGHGLAFYNGSTGATISNNIIFQVENDDMLWLIYDGGCSAMPPTGVCPYGFANDIIVNNTFVTTSASGGGPVGYVNACNTGGMCTPTTGLGGGPPWSFGSNTYSNNVIVTLTGASAPLNFQAGTITADVNSTYSNDIFNGFGTLVVGTLSTNYTCASLAGVATVSNCGTADPMLISASNGEATNNFDLHLSTGSPGIGAGTATNAPAIDIQWNARNNPPSIGAYEYGGTSVLTIVSPTSLSNAQVGVAYGPVPFMATGGTAMGYVWSVTSSCLPSALSFSAGGILSGTPGGGTAGMYSCTYTVTDSGSNVAHITLNLTVVTTAPTLTSLSPSSTTAGGPTFTLTVNGSGFLSGATAFWNSTSLTTMFVNSGQVTATVPSTLIASAGTAAITATNPGSAASTPLTFTINPAPPPGSGAMMLGGAKILKGTLEGTIITAGAITNQQTPTTCLVSGTTCTFTISATTAGNTLVVLLDYLGGTVTPPGGWTHIPSALCTGTQTVDAYYQRNTTGGTTSIVFTQSSSLWYAGTIYELHSTAGANFPQLDTASCNNSSSSLTSFTGPNLTLAGSGEAIISEGQANNGGGMTGVTNAGYNVVPTSGNGVATAYILNTGNGTGVTWNSMSASTRWAINMLAFK